jgi:hypothetical protein
MGADENGRIRPDARLVVSTERAIVQRAECRLLRVVDAESEMGNKATLAACRIRENAEARRLEWAAFLASYRRWS